MRQEIVGANSDNGNDNGKHKIVSLKLDWKYINRRSGIYKLTNTR